MQFLFVDTQGWVALSNKRDSFHQKASTIKKVLLRKVKNLLLLTMSLMKLIP